MAATTITCLHAETNMATKKSSKTKAQATTAPELRAAGTLAVKPAKKGKPAAAEAQASPMANRSAAAAPAVQPAKPAKAKKGKDQPKKVSALDAAARVLAETGQPLTCQELIAAMAAKGYWMSPGGKTPHSTLYASI